MFILIAGIRLEGIILPSVHKRLTWEPLECRKEQMIGARKLEIEDVVLMDKKYFSTDE